MQWNLPFHRKIFKKYKNKKHQPLKNVSSAKRYIACFQHYPNILPPRRLNLSTKIKIEQTITFRTFIGRLNVFASKNVLIIFFNQYLEKHMIKYIKVEWPKGDEKSELNFVVNQTWKLRFHDSNGESTNWSIEVDEISWQTARRKVEKKGAKKNHTKQKIGRLES